MNITADKSFNFAVRIVKLSQYLERKKEYSLSKQVLRSGTSIGANIREAFDGESSADFIHKLSIAQKECSETIYWLELLRATDYIAESEFDSIYNDAVEVKKIITSVIITKKKNLQKNTKQQPPKGKP